MSNLQAYKLLENGEDPAAEPDQLDTSVPISKGRRQVLESIQSLKAHFTFLQERSAGVQEKLPRWLRPICGLWSCLFILAAILIAVVVALVVLGAFAGEIAGEDVSEERRPLRRFLQQQTCYSRVPSMNLLAQRIIFAWNEQRQVKNWC